MSPWEYMAEIWNYKIGIGTRFIFKQSRENSGFQDFMKSFTAFLVLSAVFPVDSQPWVQCRRKPMEKLSNTGLKWLAERWCQ